MSRLIWAELTVAQPPLQKQINRTKSNCSVVIVNCFQIDADAKTAFVHLSVRTVLKCVRPTSLPVFRSIITVRLCERSMCTNKTGLITIISGVNCMNLFTHNNYAPFLFMDDFHHYTHVHVLFCI